MSIWCILNNITKEIVVEKKQIINKKETAESREQIRIDDDVKKIKNSSSSWYYASLILLNMISLVICFLYLDYYYSEVQKISVVFDNFDYKCIGIIIICFLIIIFLETLPIFLRIYAKTKNNNFATSLGGVIAGEFYGRVTLFRKGKLPLMTNTICKNGLKNDVVIDSVYGHKIFDNISFALYSFVVIMIGLLFISCDVNIWLLMIAILILLFNIVRVIFVFMFNSNKKKTLSLLAKIIASAYSIHLIKNYEKVYNRIVDKLMINVKDFKSNKALIFVDIFSNLLRYFLKFGAMYFILISLNFADAGVLGELIFKCTILQLILDAWPIQNGTFIFEIIFTILFANTFFEGYVWWGMILYRLFDYFLYVLSFAIFKIFDTISENKNNKIEDN